MAKLELRYFVDGVNKSFSVNLDDNLKTVGDLRKVLTQQIINNKNINNFDLIYCGSHLYDDKLIASLGFGECSTVYILKSSKTDIPPAEKLDSQTFSQIMKMSKHIFQDSQSRHWVEDKLKNAKLVEYIIEAVPAFGSDPIAMNILTDRHCLWKFIGSNKRAEAMKTLTEHPSLGYAIIILHGALNDDWSQKSNFQYKDSRSLYNIDHMSDDDGDIDDDEDDDEMDTEPHERPRRVNDNPFSRLVGGSQGLIRPYGNTPVSSSAAQLGAGLITSDFFRQAMMFASGIQAQEQQHHQPPPATASAPPSLQQPDNALIEIQMQQLREMGIMDEEYARRVLLEVGGDIQAAIERLFSEDTF